MDLPLKMQSVLMTATRGPDNHRYYSIKVVNRWMRSHLFHDADPSNPFIMHPDDPGPHHLSQDSFLGVLEHELEYVTVHYFGHFIHALEIIGWMHPEALTRVTAKDLYRECCSRVLHLPTEDHYVFLTRLGKREELPNG
jgi:hypothetical protein